VADVPRLREIEVLAGEAFRALGMDLVADDPPPDAAEYERLVDGGRAWVVTDEADLAVAYSVAEEVDGRAHVEQVSVDPAHARQGLGRDLVEEIARERGLDRWTRVAMVRVLDRGR
jgi:ribosomal protein S18 acetylase RimI-like enzyme